MSKILTYEEALFVHIGVIVRALQVLLPKRHDYSGNVGDPFRNFRSSIGLGIHPAVGALLRASDKSGRVASLIQNGRVADGGEVGENLADTFADGVNYFCLSACMVAEESPELLETLLEAGRNFRSALDGLGLLEAEDEIIEVGFESPDGLREFLGAQLPLPVKEDGSGLLSEHSHWMTYEGPD